MGDNGHLQRRSAVSTRAWRSRNKKAMGSTDFLSLWSGQAARLTKSSAGELARKLASVALGLLAKFGSSQRTPGKLDGLLKSQLSWRSATVGFLATGPSGRRAEILGFPRSKELSDLNVCGLRIDYKEVDRLVETAIDAG
jgi:hypothetical protein